MNERSRRQHPAGELGVESIDDPPATFLRSIADVFVEFGPQTQDSGNISYGIRVDRDRFFVKTAGDPGGATSFLPHEDRVALLRNAARVAESCRHPVLPALRNVIESPHGPMLVYDWLEGDLLGVPAGRREEAASAFQRFRALSPDEIAGCLDQIYSLHHELARAGWIAVDFYDGCLIYDFASKRLGVVDLDMYRAGPFVNDMGRMFGSSRFMAPEEFERGARIDERTNVFVMGRTAAVLLGDGSLGRGGFRGSDGMHAVISRACSHDPEDRFASLDAFCDAWQRARIS